MKPNDIERLKSDHFHLRAALSSLIYAAEAMAFSDPDAPDYRVTEGVLKEVLERAKIVLDGTNLDEAPPKDA